MELQGATRQPAFDCILRLGASAHSRVSARPSPLTAAISVDEPGLTAAQQRSGSPEFDVSAVSARGPLIG
jgi:hypothetical protein